MCSFNEISGIPSSANRVLLTDILRGEWKFTGFVVSDWNSIGELQQHGVAANLSDAAVLGLQAGVDMDMEANAYNDHLAAAVKHGQVTESELNEAVRRVLRVKFRLGLFDNPYKNCDAERERNDILTSNHRDAARAMARQSIVLLKNSDRLLPLAKSKQTIAVVGPLADDKHSPLGPWHAKGMPEDVISVLDGIKARVGGATRILYARGCDVDKPSKNGFAEAIAAAGTADVVIAVVGEDETMSGEAASRSHLELPGSQEELIQALQSTGKPVIAVLMNGRPLAIEWIAQHVPAIVESWFLGVETGNAVADVLFGDFNPSGKLTTSFPRTTGQVPVYYNHKNSGRPFDESQHYTSKYMDLKNTPLFPFGYGLSYTTFTYSQLELGSKVLKGDGILPVSVTVQNTGNRFGEEIVQLYVHENVATVTRPVKELKGFQKIALAPGESKTVRFNLAAVDLKYYDRRMKWTIEPGAFKVSVGPSSAEGLESEFEYQSR